MIHDSFKASRPLQQDTESASERHVSRPRHAAEGRTLALIEAGDCSREQARLPNRMPPVSRHAGRIRRRADERQAATD